MRHLLGLAVLTLCIPAASADVADSVKRLGSKDVSERRKAAQELVEAGADAAKAVKPLTKALKDESRFVRRFAAQALGNVGAAAKEAVPALEALLRDEEAPVRMAAVQALGKIGEAAIPALGKAAGKGNVSDVQEAAIDALAETGGAAALGPLVGVIKDQTIESQFRRKAIAAVQKMGASAAPSAVPALAEVVKSPKARGDARLLRQDAVAGLGNLAKASDSSALAVLNEIINDEKNRDMGLKNQCRQAVKKIMARK